jgi:hypothetical protein
MGERARQALQAHCSHAVVLQKLKTFLEQKPRAPCCNNDYGKVEQRSTVYSIGSTVSFGSTFETRPYLRAGWSITEFGFGVWSDGPTAELLFHPEPKPLGRLLLRANVSAFIGEWHPRAQVDIYANGNFLANWRFDVDHMEEAHRAWREAIIPPDIVSEGHIRVQFRIQDPASPWELGLSPDGRSLGVMLHELVIEVD